MDLLDIAFRGAASGLLLQLILLLWLRQRGLLVALFGTGLALGIIGYLWAPYAWAAWGSAWFAAPVFLFGHLVTLFLWLFALSLFEDGFRLRWVQWAVIAVYGVTWLSHQLPQTWDPPDGLVATRFDEVRFVLEHLMFLAVVVVTLIKLGSGRSTDMVERRRRLRGWVIGAIGAYSIIVVCVELFLKSNRGGIGLDTLNSGSILALTLVVTTFAFTLRPQGLVPEENRRPAKPVEEGPDAADQAAMVRLTAFFDDQKGHHQEGLTIAGLAEAIGLPEYRARRLINQSLGFRNFNALLNEYRVRDACAVLADPEQARVPVLTIALDVGYRSLGPFNRAFRELTGMTPTEYRREKLGADRADS